MTVEISINMAKPISEGDHVILYDHRKNGFTVKVEAGK